MYAKEIASKQLGQDLARLRNQYKPNTFAESLNTFEPKALGNLLSPMTRRKEGPVENMLSGIKTKNYWNKLESLDSADVPGPFVDMREMQRHKNRVQKLSERSEKYQEIFEHYATATDSVDRSQLPSYSKKSPSPLRYANEEKP